jgi:hypothetical protein
VNQVKERVAAMSAGRHSRDIDAARHAIHAAQGAGRTDEDEMQGYSTIWASELLNEDTC